MENTNPVQPDNVSAGDRMDADVQADADQLSQQLAEYESKLGEMREILLRERAEIENQRKRLQRDLIRRANLRQRTSALAISAGLRQP